MHLLPKRFNSLIAIVSLVLLLLLYSLLRGPSSSSRYTPTIHSKNAPALFLSFSAPSANATISAHLRAITAGPHLAGTPSSSAAAAYVLSHFRAAGLETFTREYYPLLSYPAAASLALHHASGELLKLLPVSRPSDPRLVPPYHAYSPSGAAFAPAVFVNLGRDEDYETLERLGVDVRGSVAVARKGGGYRGAVVERAAEKGALAVLLFGDGSGEARAGVERGTVILRGVGDPLTPDWAATEGAESLGQEEEEVRRRFPKIPSMPVAAATAEEILRTLGGPPVPHEWRGGLQLGESSGVGRGPTLVNFTYEEDRKMGTIRNVFGMIRGYEEPDRYVILGNHRDAWTYGAVDPNSGTAALLDIAQRYGSLKHLGWKPRRTIILCSWDAEEFGMIGSTEWVEQNLGNLGSKAVAYLNVDCAVQGPGFFAGATPQLDKLLIEVTKQIRDPDSHGVTVYQSWVAANGGISIERLARADSDFSAFLHHAGVPSVDLYYGRDFPVYHTAFDSYDWMEKHGDPLFHRHVAVAEIWGLLGLRLADDLILPFNYLSYAAQLQAHTSVLSALADTRESVQSVNISIREFEAAANEVYAETKKLLEDGRDEGFTELRRRAFNDRLMLAERGFLEAEGLKGRQWFKHLLYAPPEDYDSKFSFFPGIADAISRSRKMAQTEGAADVQHEIWKVSRAIQRAAGALRGNLV